MVGDRDKAIKRSRSELRSAPRTSNALEGVLSVSGAASHWRGRRDPKTVDELLVALEALSTRMMEEADILAGQFEGAAEHIRELSRRLDAADQAAEGSARPRSKRSTKLLPRHARDRAGSFGGAVDQRSTASGERATATADQEDLTERRRAILMSLRRTSPAVLLADRERSLVSEARQLFVSTSAARAVALQDPGTSQAKLPRPRVRNRARPKVSILAWDVGHNPLGRAYLLAEALEVDYDVEIIGAAFPRFGKQVWKPLRNSQIPIKWFRGSPFPEHFNQIERIASQIDGDVLLVSKPRLPSFELGMAAKALSNRPLILDIDDYEVGFVGSGGNTLSHDEISRDFHTPFGEIWTRYCESLIEHVDCITVSSHALQRRYGGTVIPHMRDEHVFQPALFDRDEIRREFGYDHDDRILLFIGTPRSHKGILDIAEALDTLGNPKYRLCVIGTVTEPDLREKLTNSYGRAQIDLFSDRPFHELPRNLCVGDLICILQDPDSVISKYQMPAKFTDALAMGIPILATDVPPLAELAREGLVELAGSEPLADKIDEIFNGYSHYKERAVHNRARFAQDYSYAANRRKLTDLVNGLLASEPPPTPRAFEALLGFHRKSFGGVKEQRARARHENRIVRFDPQPRSRPRRRSPRWEATADAPKDIVFFWKQHDTGIYGRRQDMLIKYLARDPRVRKILHFEPPLSFGKLFSLLDLHGGRRHRQNRLIFWQTVRRILGRRDSKKLKHRTYVHARRRGRLGSWIAGLFLPSERGYLDFIGKQMRKNGISPESSLFWVCPTDFQFPRIVERYNPSFIVADLIDDHRTWPVSPDYRRKLQGNYEKILRMSDLVLANNANLRQSMSSIREDIHVVPNGVDTDLKRNTRAKRPKPLAHLKGPIVGYVGNLDARRLDTSLVEHLAARHHKWQIVLIGSTHANDDVFKLSKYPNVHFIGVVPYRKVIRYVRNFDVAILPHRDNALTRNMNPLKLFLYFSLDVPIVATDVQNIQSLSEFVRTSKSKEEFVANVQRCLSSKESKIDSEARARKVEQESWQARVERITSLIQAKTLSSTAVRDAPKGPRELGVGDR